MQKIRQLISIEQFYASTDVLDIGTVKPVEFSTEDEVTIASISKRTNPTDDEIYFELYLLNSKRFNGVPYILESGSLLIFQEN